MKLKDINPQYITNDTGEKISVILPISGAPRAGARGTFGAA